MKKKSAVVIILSFALAGTVLTGCGESQPPLQNTQQSIPISIPQGNGQDSATEKTGTDAADKTETGTDSAGKTEDETGAADKTETGTDPADNTASGTDPADNTAAETDTADTNVPVSEKYEDNFAVDSQAAKEFAEKIKDAAAQKDLEALAELTSFPVYVGLPDVGVVKTKEDFLKLGAEAVFTDRLLESIEKADIENFQPSRAGFSISDGGTANVNFGVVNGALAISGINY